ncbi:MAG: EpsG family protein [Treponema sp.]|jgi:hypothetical protein|nr:EpsG family protein [Treponema sp.]
MAYLIFLCINVAFCVSLGIKNNTSVTVKRPSRLSNPRLLFLLTFGIWVLFIGLQYNVGKDYFSYLLYFSDKKLAGWLGAAKNEIFFSGLAIFVITNNLDPQLGIILCAFITMAGLFAYIMYLDVKYLYAYIYLYFTISISFYNQFNAIRQYIAVSFFLLAIICIIERKLVLYVLCILIGAGFHQSLLFLAPFYFLAILFEKSNVTVLFLALAGSSLLSVINLEKIILSWLEYIAPYAHYIGGEYAATRIPLTTRLVRYSNLPVYFLSLLCYKYIRARKERVLFAIGIFSFCLKLIALNTILLMRVTHYFEVSLVYPIYFLVKTLLERAAFFRYEKELLLIVIFLITFGILCIKCFFVSDGYTYASILFKTQG